MRYTNTVQSAGWDWNYGVPISFQLGLSNFFPDGSVTTGDFGKMEFKLGNCAWRYFQSSSNDWNTVNASLRAGSGVNGDTFTIDHSDLPNLPEQWTGTDITDAIGLPFFYVDGMQIPLGPDTYPTNLGLDMDYYPNQTDDAALNAYRYTNWRINLRIDIFDRQISTHIHRVYLVFKFGSKENGFGNG